MKGMAVTTLTRTETVMYLDPHLYGYFFTNHNDDGDFERCVEISKQDWTDMGSPDVITVTIEPGDRLNAPG